MRLQSSPIIIKSLSLSLSSKGEGNTTESAAIRCQNSYVAHINGMTTTMKMMIVVVGLNYLICSDTDNSKKCGMFAAASAAAGAVTSAPSAFVARWCRRGSSVPLQALVFDSIK